MRKILFVISIFSFSSLVWGACKKDAGLIEKGKAAYKTATCNVCHGDAGAGDGAAAVALNPKPRNFMKDAFKAGDTVEKVFTSITEGLKGTAMAPFKHVAEADRCAIANYVVSLRPKK